MDEEIVVQLVRAPPCQDGSCGFKSRQSRSIEKNLINLNIGDMAKR